VYADGGIKESIKDDADLPQFLFDVMDIE